MNKDKGATPTLTLSDEEKEQLLTEFKHVNKESVRKELIEDFNYLLTQSEGETGTEMDDDEYESFFERLKTFMEKLGEGTNKRIKKNI